MTKSTPADEQRRYTRIPFDAQVHVSGPTGAWQGVLLDISLKGILMSRPPDWRDQRGGDYQIEIILDDEVIITMRAKVAHSGIERIGFCATHIDVDSMTHLKRLVELNIANADRLRRELSSL